MRMLYTKELLEDAVAQATSVMEVMRILDVKMAGGTHTHLSNRIKALGLDTSHFLGQGHRKGTKSPKRKSAAEILVRLPEGSGRTRRAHLMRALLDVGRPYVCGLCGLNAVWNGQPLMLPVDHQDGDFLNNLAENLRFLCPNCHSQTETFCRSVVTRTV
jgi:predicted RNA-binding Zn-ribbon protein involved in translation (DUF1610 family)